MAGKVFITFIRILLGVITLFVLQIVLSIFLPVNMDMTNVDMNLMLGMNTISIVIDFIIIAIIITNSKVSGIKLALVIFVVFFITKIFQSNNEAFFFLESLKFSFQDLVNMALGGALKYLIAAPIIVLIWGKFTKQQDTEEVNPLSRNHPAAWVIKAVLLSLLFPAFYWAFGVWVYQFPEIQSYYADQAINTNNLFLFQIMRGFFWSISVFCIVRILKTGIVGTILIAGLATGILHSDLMIIPNPFMPDAVRTLHGFELLGSITSYSLLAALIMVIFRFEQKEA